ncbi:MAG TPA: hypothetical protein VNG13_02585 [Mycobacteriales bacterium]|nr:hypothetical protein [Mycobacteriales bacterium]
MAAIGLVAAGVAAGGVLASTLTAAAATSDPTQAAAVQATAAPVGPPGCPGHALAKSGTVAAVGTNTVSIKTSSGTVTYGVTSASDVDKNGEATLSALKVGDAVRFSTTTSGGATIIARLHAGNEALDRPAGGPGPAGGPPAAGSSA